MLEFPVWIVTGVIVPFSLLPGWIQPLSWILAPTWGYRAIHTAALGGNPWPGIGIALGLAAVYFFIGQAVVAAFERRARERATLSLVWVSRFETESLLTPGLAAARVNRAAS